MITIEQCRGARGILGWTQQDLADASGLSKTAINNFEKGHSDIKAESQRAIRMAFESADIEMIGQNGVTQKSETTRILRGHTALNELIEDIHTTQQNKTREVLISNVDQSLSSRISTQKLFKHIDYLKNNAIHQRILCTDEAINILSPMDECRHIETPVKNTTISTYIYGSKVAFELWDSSMIVIIDSTEAHTAERKRFEHLWNLAPTSKDTEKTKTKKSA